MKKLVFRLCISNITPPSRFLLPEKLVGSSLFLVLSSSFYLFQFLSNFFKYSFSNFLLSYPYNILTIYFPSSSSLLKSFSFAISNFSYLLTSAFILSSNSATNSLAFSKSSFFSQLSCSAMNPFHCTKYFTTPLTFLLFKILFTSYSLTSSTSTSFTSTFFCLPT